MKILLNTRFNLLILFGLLPTFVSYAQTTYTPCDNLSLSLASFSSPTQTSDNDAMSFQLTNTTTVSVTYGVIKDSGPGACSFMEGGMCLDGECWSGGWSATTQTTVTRTLSAGLHTMSTWTRKGSCNSAFAYIDVIRSSPFTPQVFSVTGGGLACDGGTNPIAIGLNGSEANVTYGLYRNGVLVTTFKPTTGGAFSFGSYQTPGTYTAATVSPCAAVAMSGNAVITNPVASSFQAWNNGISQRYFCYASPAPLATLTATSISGAVYHWYSTETGWSFTSSAGDNDTQINAAQGVHRYYVYATMNGCTSNTAFTDVEVKPSLLSVNARHDTPVCMGQNLNLHADDATGGTYSWTGPNGFTSTAQHPVINNVSAAHAGTYTVTLVNEQCSGTPSSTTVSLTLIATAGSIGSSQTICSGATPAALTNTTSGTNGTYQWQQSTDAGSTWSAISGAISATYAPGTLTATTHYKRLTISSCNTAETTPVVITVLPLPVAGTIAASGASTICVGATVTFTNTTSGANGTYQWQSSPNGTTWTNISGATAATYTTPALTVNTSYRRNVVSASCSTASTSPVSITVQPLPVAGSIGSSQTICSGATPAAFTNTTSGSNGTYQWQSSANGGSTWSTISGATAATYAPGALTATTHYRRNVVSANCGTVSTTSVIITVTPLPVAGEIEANQTICAGVVPALLTNKTSGVNGTYQWESSATGTTWVAISGATESTYQPPVLSSTTLYRRNTTSGCGVASSVAVTITVIPLPVAGVIGGGPQTICSGITPASLTDVTSGVGTYQWQLSIDAGTTWSDIVGATGATYAPGALTVTTHYRRGATSCNSTVYTTSMVVSIHPPASAGQIGGAQTLCSGSTPTALTNVTAGFNTYQWQSSPNGTTWTTISGATAATYAPPALTATTRYRRNATSCGITVSSNVIIKTVTQPKKADFTYGGSPYCPWHSAINPPVNPVVTFTNGGVAGAFSASPSGLSITPGSGAINLNQSNSGTYTVTNTIAAAGGCPVVTKTATLEIRPRTTFTINEVEENGIRNYYIEQAASDPVWAASYSYTWWYINVKPRRVNATDDNYPWMTVGMFQPLSFVLDIVTDESLIIDVTENSTGCKTRVELGRDVVDGTF